MEYNEELSLDNLLDSNDLDDMFEEPEESKETEQTENKEKDNTTEEISEDDLFDSPESVGSEDTEEKENTSSNKEGASPNNNFYSSMTKALVEDGVFPDLKEEDISNIKSAEDFVKMMKDQQQAMLDETQQRVNKALNVGVEPSEIQKYEGAINQLEGITSEQLNQENAEGEKLRKWIIYNDYLSKGFSEERAQKEVTKAINAGSDLEDAKESLDSMLNHYKKEYQKLIDDAEAEDNQYKEEQKKQAEELKNSILESKKVFGNIELDKSTRKQIYENISKPVYKNKEGQFLTAIQQYESENRVEFLKNVSLFYTLTDGFKNIDKLIKPSVNKEMKRGLRELETKLNNTSRASDGSIKFVTGVSEDPEAFLGKDWKLDI